MSTINEPERQAEWGHWAITFVWHTPGDYAPDRIVGTLNFPVGNQGPCDAMPGQRERYTAAIKAWRETGALPQGFIPWDRA